MQEPYYIQYSQEYGFYNIPLGLKKAIKECRVLCCHPEKIIQDIWDLSGSYDDVPTLVIVETGEEFRMGGAPITYKDVHGDNNVN